jgi:polyhydroxyalkanoate synthase
MSGNPQPDAAAMQNLFQAGQAFAQGFMHFMAQQPAAGACPPLRCRTAPERSHRQPAEVVRRAAPGAVAEPCCRAAPRAGRGEGQALSLPPEWSESPYFDYLRQAYLLNAEFLGRLADAVPGDEAARERLRVLHPPVRRRHGALQLRGDQSRNSSRRRLKTQGASITAGIKNLLEDLAQGPHLDDRRRAFEVGRNLATTPGQVIFENELIQLIQYDPATPKVHERPLVIVPPCINKFYILDLQPAELLRAPRRGAGHDGVPRLLAQSAGRSRPSRLG